MNGIFSIIENKIDIKTISDSVPNMNYLVYITFRGRNPNPGLYSISSNIYLKYPGSFEKNIMHFESESLKHDFSLDGLVLKQLSARNDDIIIFGERNR